MTGDLHTAKALTEPDIGAAADASMTDTTTGAFLFGDDCRIGLAEAVRARMGLRLDGESRTRRST